MTHDQYFPSSASREAVRDSMLRNHDTDILRLWRRIQTLGENRAPVIPPNTTTGIDEHGNIFRIQTTATLAAGGSVSAVRQDTGATITAYDWAGDGADPGNHYGVLDLSVNRYYLLPGKSTGTDNAFFRLISSLARGSVSSQGISTGNRLIESGGTLNWGAAFTIRDIGAIQTIHTPLPALRIVTAKKVGSLWVLDGYFCQ